MEDGSEERNTNGKSLETLFEILLIVGLESRSPNFKFSFEGHCGGGEEIRRLKVGRLKGEELVTTSVKCSGSVPDAESGEKTVNRREKRR